jgi:hypothetical protein
MAGVRLLRKYDMNIEDLRAEIDAIGSPGIPVKTKYCSKANLIFPMA